MEPFHLLLMLSVLCNSTSISRTAFLCIYIVHSVRKFINHKTWDNVACTVHVQTVDTKPPFPPTWSGCRATGDATCQLRHCLNSLDTFV